MFNNNEIGQQVDTELIKSIERVYNEGTEKSFKLLGESISMITWALMPIFHSCVQKSQNRFTV